MGHILSLSELIAKLEPMGVLRKNFSPCITHNIIFHMLFTLTLVCVCNRKEIFLYSAPSGILGSGEKQKQNTA